jgi:hypothetical protein
MIRIYENRGFFIRQNGSVAVLLVVIVYGVFELWRAFTSAGGDATGTMFGVLFIGGGIWGFYTLWTDGRDVIAALDADFAARQAVFTLWGPFTRKRLVESLDDVLEWRFWVKPGARGQRSFFLHAVTRSYPRPMQIELKRGEPVPDGLRQIAPAAVAEFEAMTRAVSG